MGSAWILNVLRGSLKAISVSDKKPLWILKTTNNVSKRNLRSKNLNTINSQPNLKMNKLLLPNFKRKSRNFKPELKNLKKNSKPNVLLELKLKNNAPSFQENLK